MKILENEEFKHDGIIPRKFVVKAVQELKEKLKKKDNTTYFTEMWRTEKILKLITEVFG